MYIAPIIQFQGDAKAPRKMKEGPVYNLIDKLDPTDSGTKSTLKVGGVFQDFL